MFHKTSTKNIRLCVKSSQKINVQSIDVFPLKIQLFIPMCPNMRPREIENKKALIIQIESYIF